MNHRGVRTACACVLSVVSALTIASAQSAARGQSAQQPPAQVPPTPVSPEVAAHKTAAETAAGTEFATLKRVSCAERERRAAPAAGANARPATPPREQWYAAPVKVFDNLYFIGTREHGAWALTTSAGIIVIDALYDYAVIDAVEAGIKKVGLDPADMKYLIITHGHGDHHGGTRYLQDKYRPKVVMGAQDWDLVARDTRSPRPTKDVSATDGQKITLGDTTVTLYVTPGHTPTTLSLMLPVKDGGVAHTAVEWGGTALNPDTPLDNIRRYLESAVRFRQLAAAAKADVLIANHTVFDGTLAKLDAVGRRQPGQLHPWVVGPTVVDRYMAVVEECARALVAAR
jgi:metallo-beta-lactamase class B